ncbi:hypothetical protein TESG_08645 [Trichophyton tonsurans CBS 112818]|uniref:Uncharacterized protein n=1 Tax=Trichophyton tonsurans (strain CBS 112818) TaxID=647933 RepID=F2S9V9_TRIT1|nr:hypothetical protein TESG_08645 [Trichophyton tonsurans CBS 112818]
MELWATDRSPWLTWRLLKWVEDKEEELGRLKLVGSARRTPHSETQPLEVPEQRKGLLRKQTDVFQTSHGKHLPP